MNEPLRDGPMDPDEGLAADGQTLSPLPGEPGIPNVATASREAMSRKGLLAVGLMVGGIVAAAAASIYHYAGSGGPKAAPESSRVSSRPATASAEPRRLEMTPVRSVAEPSALPGSALDAPSSATGSPRIPALLPGETPVEPIGVRRTGTPAGAPRSGGPREMAPEDAPVLLVSSRPGSVAPGRGPASGPAPSGEPVEIAAGPNSPSAPLCATTRNLQQYQQQLQGLLTSLTQSAALATGQAPPLAGTLLSGAPMAGPSVGGPSSAGPQSGADLFGGQLAGSATPRVAAGTLGDRSLTLPKGTAFTCALKTRVISATSGLVGCLVQRNVYSDDGRVLLIERGSHLDGEYRIQSVRAGMVRIPVLWTRIRTPLGVTVDIGSPGTGPLGEAGIDGHVDKRWGERIGAALLFSLIDDSVKLVVQNQTADRDASTIVLPSTTASTSKLAEKVLDSTINIPPLIYQNQGGIVGIYVARDVDFSSVYALQPSER